MTDRDMAEDEQRDMGELVRISKKAVRWRRQMVAHNLARARANALHASSPKKWWYIATLMVTSTCGAIAGFTGQISCNKPSALSLTKFRADSRTV